MLKAAIAVLVLALGACATRPTPPTCGGDLVPINAPAARL